MRKGFTLIELLVVVLIIGILASIALPQYQKAVEKARISEALQNMSALQRAVDVYLLENGYPDEYLGFFGIGAGNGMLSVALNADCSNGDICVSKNAVYQAACSNTSCYVRAWRGADNNQSFELQLVKNKGADTWEKTCIYEEEKEYVCKGLEPLGFTRSSCC